jgi:hypothetical protein
MVQTFDFANADTSTSRRVNTTVPQQALFAMNSPFMLEASRGLASRVGEAEPPVRVERLFELALGRAPQADELEQSREFLTHGSLEQLAQVLLMSNELMFID